MERQRILRRLREALEAMDGLLCGYVENIKARLPESAIILFGSRARGNYRPHSDFDLMIIIRDNGDIREAFDVAVKLKPKALPVDLLVLSVEDLEDPLRIKMLEEGCIVLYDGLGLSLPGLLCKTRVCP